MSDFFAECHHEIQDAFDSRRLADIQERGIVHNVFTDAERDFISNRDMFFLATVDPSGQPTVSYKGGDTGFVRFDGNALLFPSYNGNGMFLSMGNLSHHRKVGLLFIDFEIPKRLRVHGDATLLKVGETETFPGAEMLVRVTPTAIFVNCPRYIHRYRKEGASRYVPKAHMSPPLPAWKRIDYVRQYLSEDDRQRVDELGTITPDQYEQLVASGEA